MGARLFDNVRVDLNDVHAYMHLYNESIKETMTIFFKGKAELID